MPIRGLSHTERLSIGVQLQQFAERRYVTPGHSSDSCDSDEVTFIGKFAGISNPSISPSLK